MIAGQQTDANISLFLFEQLLYCLVQTLELTAFADCHVATTAALMNLTEMVDRILHVRDVIGAQSRTVLRIINDISSNDAVTGEAYDIWGCVRV